LVNLQISNAKAIKPNICPEATPLFNGTACIVCPKEQFYDLKNKVCYTPLQATNLNFLSASKLYI